MPPSLMTLELLLPFAIFAQLAGVARVVVDTRDGSYGFLPHRLDCVAALAPGILSYAIGAQPEVYVATDEGVLVKTGARVVVSVRRALAGNDLGRLRETVEHEYRTLDRSEQEVRAVMAHLESGLIARFARLHDA